MDEEQDKIVKKSHETGIRKAFRFTVESDNPCVEIFTKTVNPDLVGGLLTLDLFDTDDDEATKWILSFANGPKTITIHHFDGSGSPSGKKVFEGCTIVSHEFPLYYTDSEPATHELLIAYDRVTI
jgi:hypothetical protein